MFNNISFTALDEVWQVGIIQNGNSYFRLFSLLQTKTFKNIQNHGTAHRCRTKFEYNFTFNYVNVVYAFLQCRL